MDNPLIAASNPPPGVDGCIYPDEEGTDEVVGLLIERTVPLVGSRPVSAATPALTSTSGRTTSATSQKNTHRLHSLNQHVQVSKCAQAIVDDANEKSNGKINLFIHFFASLPSNNQKRRESHWQKRWIHTDLANEELHQGKRHEGKLKITLPTLLHSR